MIAGFLPAESQLRQRAMEFYLRRLTYSDDLTAEDVPTPLNNAVSPRDIITQELRQLDRISSDPSSPFSSVDTHKLWLTDPTSVVADITPSILDRDIALDQI